MACGSEGLQSGLVDTELEQFANNETEDAGSYRSLGLMNQYDKQNSQQISDAIEGDNLSRDIRESKENTTILKQQDPQIQVHM